MTRRTTPAHPPFPQAPAGHDRARHALVFSALKHDASASRVRALALAAWNKGQKNTEEALWDAFSSLIHERDRALGNAQKCGQLLFCWHGTKATEVPA